MTPVRDEKSSALSSAIELLQEQGFDGMRKAIEILMNEAMKLERSEALGASPWERSEQRKGYANGFKPKVVKTRLGELELDIPQTRGVEFYPKSLERGNRSERALKLAVAEMYVQGDGSRRSQKSFAVSKSVRLRCHALQHFSTRNWRSFVQGNSAAFRL